MRLFMKLRVLVLAIIISIFWMITLRGAPSLYNALTSILSPTHMYDDWTASFRRTALFGSSKLVHTFSSVQDEVLYVYQKYMLTEWKPQPALVKTHRREVFRTADSTTTDEFVLTLENTNVDTLLPFYSPVLGSHAPFFQPQPSFLQYLPKSAILPNGTLFDKCSVVGNGGILSGSACGKEIDSADFILRCNMVPIKKFRIDAGIKTNLTTMNPSITATRYHSFKTDEDIALFIKDLDEYSGQLFLPCLYDSKIMAICVNKILPSIIERLHSKKLAITVGNSKHLLGIMKAWKPAGINFMSTGFYLAQTALTMCNEVHLYGFWPFSRTVYPVPRPVKYHFYDDREQSNVHKFSSEFQILWQLHMEGALKLHTQDCESPD